MNLAMMIQVSELSQPIFGVYSSLDNVSLLGDPDGQKLQSIMAWQPFLSLTI